VIDDIQVMDPDDVGNIVDEALEDVNFEDVMDVESSDESVLSNDTRYVSDLENDTDRMRKLIPDAQIGIGCFSREALSDSVLLFDRRSASGMCRVHGEHCRCRRCTVGQDPQKVAKITKQFLFAIKLHILLLCGR
ncbi:hypothetical protein ALC62_03216, partial [Cyphomyrmex costatus]